MPMYEYACEACGSFTAVRRIDERDAPQPCPGCGHAARRQVTATMLALMPSARRVAHAGNERSAHAQSRVQSGAADRVCFSSSAD